MYLILCLGFSLVVAYRHNDSIIFILLSLSLKLFNYFVTCYLFLHVVIRYDPKRRLIVVNDWCYRFFNYFLWNKNWVIPFVSIR